MMVFWSREKYKFRYLKIIQIALKILTNTINKTEIMNYFLTKSQKKINIKIKKIFKKKQFTFF